MRVIINGSLILDTVDSFSVSGINEESQCLLEAESGQGDTIEYQLQRFNVPYKRIGEKGRLFDITVRTISVYKS